LNRTIRQRRRRAALLAVSVGLHGVLLGLLAIGGGVMRYRIFNDDDAVHIQLVRPDLPHPPRPATRQAQALEAPPVHARAAAPTPIPPTVAPLPFAARPPAPGGGANTGPLIGSAPHPGPLPPGPQANIRGALRGSVFGCTNAEAIGLNRAERDKCDERMGAIGLAAAPQRADIDPSRRREWDYDAARAEARRRRGQPPIGKGVDTSGGPGAAPVPF
jgi:hypothetical protein